MLAYWSQLLSHLASGGTTVLVVHELDTVFEWEPCQLRAKYTATPPAAPTATLAKFRVLLKPDMLSDYTFRHIKMYYYYLYLYYLHLSKIC